MKANTLQVQEAVTYSHQVTRGGGRVVRRFERWAGEPEVIPASAPNFPIRFSQNLPMAAVHMSSIDPEDGRLDQALLQGERQLAPPLRVLVPALDAAPPPEGAAVEAGGGAADGEEHVPVPDDQCVAQRRPLQPGEGTPLVGRRVVLLAGGEDLEL